ncbi:MAG: hypothetical protein ABJA67_13465, partial [Chthonomonadales bacterium]
MNETRYTVLIKAFNPAQPRVARELKPANKEPATQGLHSVAGVSSASRTAGSSSILSRAEQIRNCRIQILFKAFDPNQARVPKGGMGKYRGGQFAPSWLRQVAENPTEELLAIATVPDREVKGPRSFVNYAAVSNFTAARIKEITGQDVSNYVHKVDQSAVNHVINRHGDEKIEGSRNQIPVTPKDFAHLPDIVNNPDWVEYAGRTKKGLDVIVYGKQVDGYFIVLEELRGV